MTAAAARGAVLNRRVLAVDSDARVLDLLQRHFRDVYELHLAPDAATALAALRDGKLRPAVILCDVAAPGQDGTGLLAALAPLAPDAARLALAANPDLEMAMDAINDGHIFRFLTKPCTAEALRAAIEAGLEQHRLVTAEHDLLEKTLAGSVKVLTDVLALAMPDAFSRASRAAAWVQRLGAAGFQEARWQLNLAARLSPLGLVSLPPDVLAKLHARQTLTEAELAMVQRAPGTARRLIANIPRLRLVADIVYLQHRGYDGTGFPEDGPSGAAIPPEARLLHILNALAAVGNGMDPSPRDFALLCSHAACYDMPMLERVRAVLETDATAGAPIALATWLLLPGMHLAEPVHNLHGALLLASGIQLSETQVDRLCHLAKYGQIRDRVSVRANQTGRPV